MAEPLAAMALHFGPHVLDGGVEDGEERGERVVGPAPLGGGPQRDRRRTQLAYLGHVRFQLGSTVTISRCRPWRSISRYSVVRSTPARRAALDMLPPARPTSQVR